MSTSVINQFPNSYAEALTASQRAFEPGRNPVDALDAWFLFEQKAVTGQGQAAINEANAWWYALHFALVGNTGSSARRWFQQHRDDQVETYQVHSDGRTWQPGPRAVTAVRSTFVELAGSRRHFREFEVVAVAEPMLVIKTETAICAYLVRWPDAPIKD